MELHRLIPEVGSVWGLERDVRDIYNEVQTFEQRMGKFEQRLELFGAQIVPKQVEKMVQEEQKLSEVTGGFVLDSMLCGSLFLKGIGPRPIYKHNVLFGPGPCL